ncbi:MAG TPA: glycosyltransferase family 2 protein [Candidatus Dormibacteraeota bacterium]|nr:glycosyltransferase family 2 protein [Candidatus Dormibacteraeota bacterium]
MRLRGRYYAWVPFWPATLRAKVLLVGGCGAVGLGVWIAQAALWSSDRNPARWVLWTGSPVVRGPVGLVAELAMLTWLLPIPPMLMGFLGYLLLGSPAPALELRSIPQRVCFRIVSRGQNRDVLRETVENLLEVMGVLPLFSYAVEVVTDLAVAWPAPRHVHFLCVPAGYRTRSGARHKARALQYALEVSPVAPSDWLVHLDEETQLTPSAVVGIAQAIDEEERSQEHRIGQGAILYHRRFGLGFKALLLSMADMVRTGDDLGRFHLQHQLGLPLFGLHGSYIVVRNSVEREVGFDLGPEGSVTEDAFWALAQLGRGRRTRWVHGYMVEQPPARIRDFLRQRRRWLWGLLLVLRHAPAPWWTKLGMGVCVFSWALSWVGLLTVYGDLVVGQLAWWPVRLSGDVCVALYAACYVIGLRENLHYVGVSRWKRWPLYLVELACLPVFALLEGAAVVYGLATRGGGMGFHVISKPATRRGTHERKESVTAPGRRPGWDGSLVGHARPAGPPPPATGRS